MSLAVVFKGPEGLVLAADSRVTLTSSITVGQNQMLLPSHYDSATKLLKVEGQKYVGTVTYDLGALGVNEYRTAHSFIPEFEADLKSRQTNRLTVAEFSNELSDFFMAQWNQLMPAPPNYTGRPFIFVVGGYNEGEAYGRVFEINIPYRPQPREVYDDLKVFGITIGGQDALIMRLLGGYAPESLKIIKDKLNLDDSALNDLRQELDSRLALSIPYELLPLQDCIDLSVFLIRLTIQMQGSMIGIRGVGGAIDVAIINKTEGLCILQQKAIRGG